jgi:hypothetical protein
LELAVLVPIFVLLAAGTWIALRSGVGQLSTDRDYLQIAGNLSQMVLRIATYLVILLVVHYLIGLRPSFGW